MLPLQPTGGGELGSGVVDPDRTRTSARQPCGNVRRTAPKLDDVLASQGFREYV
jgi:hypothetical protein